MSAMPRFSAAMGYTGLRMSAAEYMALDETEDRNELIHGLVCMSPPSDPAHGDIVFEIGHQIKSFGARVFTEIDLRISEDTVYRPDLCVYRPGRLVGRVRRLPLPPDLIVEALSPSNRALDLITKRADYDRAGVPEYWVADPATIQVRCWRRQGVQMVEVPVTGDSFECSSIAGFALNLRLLRAIFGDAPEPGGA